MTDNNIDVLPSFDWTENKHKAAALVAEGKLIDVKIAQTVGVTIDTLYKWKRNAIFQFRVKEILDEYQKNLVVEGIANKQNRINRYNKTWNDLQAIIAARAIHPSFQDVPGGNTGLMIRIEKRFGRSIEVRYEIDNPLLEALLKLEKQAATELGQYDTGSNDIAVLKAYIGIDIDRV